MSESPPGEGREGGKERLLRVSGDGRGLSVDADDRFPYTDTLKVLSKWGPGSHFFGIGGAEDIPKLQEYLETVPEGEGRTLALFCEFPGNPLLKSPDLLSIRKLADQYGFIVVVDETIGNFINVEVASVADIVVSSLTKIFSGDANVMGGWCVASRLVVPLADAAA